MGSDGNSVLDSGGPLRCSRTARRLSSLVGRRPHAILRPGSGRVRARRELVGRSQLWPEEPTFKRKTGRSESGQTRTWTLATREVRFTPDCVAKLPLMRIANHDSVGGDGIGGSGA
jgi:hypothetical protein